MWTQLVTWGLALLGLYLLAGLVFALVFVTRRVGRIDPDAREGSWGFRLLIVPGLAALWPLFVSRAPVESEPASRERSPHREVGP